MRKYVLAEYVMLPYTRCLKLQSTMISTFANTSQRLPQGTILQSVRMLVKQRLNLLCLGVKLELCVLAISGEPN